MLEGSGKPTGGGGCVNSNPTLSFVEQNVTFAKINTLQHRVDVHRTEQ